VEGKTENPMAVVREIRGRAARGACWVRLCIYTGLREDPE